MKVDKKPTWKTSTQIYLDLKILGLGEVEEGEGSQEEEEDGPKVGGGHVAQGYRREDDGRLKWAAATLV